MNPFPPELWRAAPRATGGPMVHSEFSTVSMARESGQLTLGRGGFCLWTDVGLREGPAGFELRFSAGGTRIAGHGSTR